MFKLVALIITIALIAYLAMRFDFKGLGTDKTNSPGDSIPRAKDTIQQDTNRTNQVQEEIQNQLYR
jgi:hypothetical protein